MLRKPLFLCLFAALLFQGRLTTSRACQYCHLAATDPEAARMAAAIHGHGGSFPLDSALNQFQGIAPSATLTESPPADRVATSVADLPPATARLTASPAVASPVVAPVIRSASPAPHATSLTSNATAASTAWADAGLLGLASAGGWFVWRTRRAVGPVS